MQRLVLGELYGWFGADRGIRVDEVEDALMQKIRYLDKLIDELAKGKKIVATLARLLRQNALKRSRR